MTRFREEWWDAKQRNVAEWKRCEASRSAADQRAKADAARLTDASGATTSDARAAGKVSQHDGAVVGDRGNADAPGFEVARFLSQLDQLGLAVRSPIGRPHESQQQPVLAAKGGQIAHCAGLIGEPEVRYALAHLRPRLQTAAHRRQRA